MSWQHLCPLFSALHSVFHIDSQLPTSLILEVYDLSGACHYRGYHQVINGEIPLKLSHLKLGFSGMYHIMVRDGQEVKSTKL